VADHSRGCVWPFGGERGFGYNDTVERREKMKKIPPIALVLLAAFLSAAPVLAQSPIDINGDWEVKFETPMGERVYTATFAQDGETFKVVMKSQQGTELKSEGTLKGAEIAWTVIVSGPMGEIPLAFKGKVEGETMAGTVGISDMGEAEFKAKRIK
jgi:hypothetical protein